MTYMVFVAFGRIPFTYKQYILDISMAQVAPNIYYTIYTTGNML